MAFNHYEYKTYGMVRENYDDYLTGFLLLITLVQQMTVHK